MIASNGSVGIGSVNTGSFKLAVDGMVGEREVKVTLDNPWPDYVFESYYPLMSLENLNEFISINKHLPRLPSAKEIEENNGYGLGEMQILLLEKIEELYLHVIRLEKENNELKEILCLEK
jgi:hypothetical protein